MPNATIGALTINLEGNDSQLRALLAKYEQTRTLKLDVQASGLSGSDAGLKGFDATVKGLSTNLKTLTDAITAAGTAQSRAFGPSRDTGLQAAARGVKILSDEYKQGGISAAEYGQRSTQLRTTLELLRMQASPLSRELATVQSALVKLSTAEGQAGKASPIADRFRLESAAAKQATETMNVYRMAWQRKDADDGETINRMQALEKGILAQKTAYEQETKALIEKGVLDKAETGRLAELTTLQNRLGQALRTSASVQAEVNGEFLKGSLGMNVQRGVVSALQQTTAETERLQNAERAGLITKNELKVGLEGQAAAQKTALSTMQTEAATLRELGVLDLQQTERLALLTREQNGYTAALANTVGAQERSAGMSAKSAFIGGAGMKSGMNDAAMALSFVSPQAGMIGMAASMGPVVAGAAAIGLALGGVVKLTVDGQHEAKALQQAYLNLQTNGVTDIKAVDTALNHMIQTGSTSDKMFTKSELAGALAQLSRSGFKGADGMTALSTATRLATAEGIPLSEATKNMAANLQHLGLAGTDAASFGDKIVRASHLSQDSANDFSKGMNVIGFTAQKLGYSIDETMGMLVALSKKGLDPATIGSTGLRNAMQLIEHPSKKAAAAFAELGVATLDASGHAKTGRDIFMDLMDKVSRTGPVYSATTHHLMTANDLAAINFEIFGTRSATAFIGVQDGAKEATASIKESQGFAVEASDRAASSLENTQKRQKVALENLGGAFAKSFTGILTTAAEAITNFLTKITPEMNKISDFMQMLENAHGFHEISTTLKINAGDGFTLSAVKLLTGGAVIVGGVTGFVGKSIGDQISASALQVELLKRNILQPSMIPIAGPLAQLNMIKEDMAYYIKAVNDYDAKHVGNAAPSLFAPGDARGLVIPTSASGPIGAANMNVLGATLGQTGNPEADNLIGWCARWVKLTLDKAQPGAKAEIDKWFGGDANDVRTRLMSNKRLESFNGDPKTLKPGDVVVYNKDKSGAGHIGIYIGEVNGKPMVRGNNELGGRDGAPVTDEGLNSLGSIAGIVRAAAAASGFTGMAPSLAGPINPPKAPPEMDPNFKGSSVTSLKALKDEMLRLTAAFKSGKMDVDAYHSAVEVLRQKAGALADTQKTGGKEWTATEQFIIKASNALKGHTAATQQAALTWAQYKPLREQALKLAQQESDMNDHKLTPQAETALKGTLQNYRNDPVRALALEQASQELADRQKRSEDAKKLSDQTQKDADKAATEHDKALKDQAKARAETMKALREDDVKAAKASLDHLKELQDQALANDKDNVVKLLATKAQYAKDVFALQHEINLAEYNQSVRDANNGRVQERPKLLATAQTTFNTAELAAQNAQNDTTRTATDAVTSAVQKQRDAYSKLADSLRQHTEAGDLDSKTQQDLTKQFNDLGRETDKLGLTNDKYVKGARVVTYGLIEQGHAAYLTAQRNQGMVSGNTEAADSALNLATELQGVGDTERALSVLQTTYDKLSDSLSRGEASADSVSKLRVALETLQDSLGTEAAVSDWLATLDGSIDEQMAAVTAKILDPATTESFRRALRTVQIGGAVVPGTSMGEAGQQAVIDQKARNEGEARNVIWNLANDTGGQLTYTMKDAAALLASDVGKTLEPATRDALQAGIDGAMAGMKSLSEVLADPTAFGDSRDRAKVKPNPYDPNAAALNLANQDSVTGSNEAMDSTRLEAQHAQGLIREADYLQKRKDLEEVAAYNALQIADRDYSKHTANLAAYNAQMLAIDSKYQTDKKALDETNQAADLAAANTHATNMLALERSNQQAALTSRQAQHGISDRAAIDSQQSLDMQAAEDKYKAAFNTAGSDMTLAWAQWEADKTAATEKAVLAREALDKAEVDTLISGIDALGSALGGMQSMAGAALTTLGGALKLSQSITTKGGLFDQTKAAFGEGGSIFDKLGAAGGWLGTIATGIGLVGQLGDAIMNLSPAYQAAKKAALELAQAEQAAMGSKNYGGKSILNPYYDKLKADADALTTKANAGFWQQLGWAIFGGAPKTLDKAAAEALTAAGTIFNDFAGSLYGSMESALLNAFDTGDFSSVSAAIEKSLNQLVAKMYLQTLIAKSNISKDLEMLADDQAAGKSITADVARIKTDSASIVSQFQAGSAALPGFGAGATVGATGSGSSSVIGAGPSALYGVPEIKFPDSVMAGFTAFNSSIPIFAAGSQRLLDAANLIVSTLGPGAVGRSNNGGLV